MTHFLNSFRLIPFDTLRSQTAVRMMMLSLLALGMVRGAKGSESPSDGDNPHLWRPRTRSVAVFKNGFGFFTREGSVELHDGWCAASEIPPAAFGTLAIYALSEDLLVDRIGSGPGETFSFDGVDQPDSADARLARLEACRGLKVAVTFTRKGVDATAAGTLLSVDGKYAVLETAERSEAVPVASVKRLQMLDLPMRVHVAADRSAATGQVNLGMAYLREGITWVPEYTLRILDDGAAELSLRGTLVNDAEDLIHSDVHLIVGVPHFAHTTYLAPIAVGQVIRTLGTAVAPDVFRGQMMSRAAIASNTMTAHQFDAPSDVVERRVDTGGGGRPLQGNIPALGGAAATDYAMYTVRDLTVRRGERAILTLFTHRIAYEDLYRWEPPERIRHALLLKNRTDTPWTTGPCLTLARHQPLSEDVLAYTPIGGDCEVPVTTAINIAHDQSEAEVNRKLKYYAPTSHSHLDLVTVGGELKLRNLDRKRAMLRVRVRVQGRPIAASDGGDPWTDPEKLVLRELSGWIRWEVALEPSESKALTYEYERYVPSN